MELLLLKLRNAIVDKEFCVVRANRDITQYGAWSCDYDDWMKHNNEEINKILKEIEQIKNPATDYKSVNAKAVIYNDCCVNGIVNKNLDNNTYE